MAIIAALKTCTSSECLLFICVVVMVQAPPCFSHFLVFEPLPDVHGVWAFHLKEEHYVTAEAEAENSADCLLNNQLWV